MIPRAISTLRIALISVGALLTVVTLTPIVSWVVAPLSADWSDSDGDVLIVLSGSMVTYPGYPSGIMMGTSTYARALSAIHVWRSGHFKTVLVCGAGSAETVKPFLVAYGVPDYAILVENRSNSTRENALFAKRLLNGMPGRYVLLTSDYHMYRASKCFAHEGIKVATRPFPDLTKRSRSLPARWPAFWEVVQELGKITYYRIRGWI